MLLGPVRDYAGYLDLIYGNPEKVSQIFRSTSGFPAHLEAPHVNMEFVVQKIPFGL